MTEIVPGQVVAKKARKLIKVMRMLPKPTCKYCAGTGIITYVRGDYEKKVQCSCVRPRKVSEKQVIEESKDAGL